MDLTDERTVLVALYSKTGGTNWNYKDNWETNQPISEWYGVTTNSNGQVISLVLIHNKLSGSIPVELAQLSNLTHLLLEGNELSGPIPTELAQLSNLTHLLLEDNAGLYLPTDAEFQAWRNNLKEFSIDNSDRAEAQPPAQSPDIERLQDDLAEREETIAEVARQAEDAAQQWSALEAKKTKLDAEFETRNKELKNKNKELEDKQVAFQKRCNDLEEVETLLSKLKTKISRIDEAIKEIHAESPDFVLRVDDTGQTFHDAVVKFLQSQKKGIKIMKQIGDMLRLHHRDDDQILEALKQWEVSEAPSLDTAIDLVNNIAKNLGDLDRCLETLTKKHDSTN